MRPVLPITKVVATITIFVAVVICESKSNLHSGEKASYLDSPIIRSLTAKDLPNQSGVILLDRRVHTYSLIETEITHTFAVKILTQEGIEQFGNFKSRVLHDKHDKYDLAATVISPSGNKTLIGSADKHKVKIGKHYSQYRMALPGLEVGSIVEIHETLKTEAPIMSGYWDFASHVTTLKSELIYKVPRGVVVGFRFTPKSAATTSEPVVEGRLDVYSITRENVPPYVNEKFMSPNHIGNPSLYYYIWEISREDVAQFLFKRSLKEISRESGVEIEHRSYHATWNSIVPPLAGFFDPSSWKNDKRAAEYGAAADSLVANIRFRDKSNFELLLEDLLGEFCRTFQRVEDPLFYRTSNPEESLILREGGPITLAYVLKLLLSKLNIWSSIVMVRNIDEGALDERIPDPNALTHALVFIEADDKQYWIDPYAPECGANRLLWMFQGARGVWLKAGREFAFRNTALDQASRNNFVNWEELEIDQDGNLSGEAKVTLSGQYAWLLRNKAGCDGIEKDNEYLISFLDREMPYSLKRERLRIERDTRDTLTVSFHYKLDHYAHRSGTFMNLDLSPWCGKAIYELFESQSRKYDIEFPFIGTRVTTVKIRAPGNAMVVEAGENAEHKNSVFSYSKVCFQDGNSIVFRRNLAIRQRTVPTKDYSDTRAFTELMRKSDNESVVLKIES